MKTDRFLYYNRIVSIGKNLIAALALLLFFCGGGGMKAFAQTVTFNSNTPGGRQLPITQSGYYYVEAWGGKGGDGGNSVGASGGIGGKTDKVSGIYYIAAGTAVYVQVGAAGDVGSGTNGGAIASGAYFGSGGKGGSGGQYAGMYNSGAGGGGGGAASGILIGGTALSNIRLAAGGGGGGGGGAGGSASNQTGANGGANDNNAANSNQAQGSTGTGQRTDSPNGSDGGNGANGVQDGLHWGGTNGGGGGGAGGGGFNGSSGGGGNSGGGGDHGETKDLGAGGFEAGGGGAGGKDYKATEDTPAHSYTVPNNTYNGANGRVVITLILPTYTVIYEPGTYGNWSAAAQTTDKLYLNDPTPSFFGGNPPASINPGFEFNGWSPSVAGTVTGNAIYTAQWRAKTYTLTFDSNGGTAGSMTSKSVTYNAAAGALPTTAAGTAPIRSGYTFMGWSTTSGTSNAVNFSASTTYSWTENKTVYAVWQANEYSIIYNGNGATSGSMNAQTATYNQNLQLTANAFKKQGYTFAGWDSNGDNTADYSNSQNITPWTLTANLTLTALWTPKTYTVKFETGIVNDGGTFYGYWYADAATDFSIMTGAKMTTIPDVTNVGWDDVLTIPPRWLYIDATDYFFSHWQVTANGKTTEPISGNVTFGYLAANDDVSYITITAFWDKYQYHVYLDYDDGTPVTTLGAANSTAAITLPTISPREGYTLTAGSEWKVTHCNETAFPGSVYGAGTTTYATIANDYYTVHGGVYPQTVTLTAQRTANPYVVTFNGNGNDGGSMANQNFTYNVEQQLSVNTYTKTGYHFIGWGKTSTTKTYDDNERVKNLSSTKDDVVMLYAIWAPNTYEVEFNANGGTGAMSKQNFTYNVSKNLEANDFNKTGYTFLGWNTNSLAITPIYTDQQSVSNLTPDNNGSVKLYAIWQAITYKVRFNGNGNDGGAMSDQPLIYDVSANLTANGFGKTGYSFKGWDTNSAGGTAVYADGASVNNLASVQDAIINLYAVWEANSYTVTFNANGGTAGMVSKGVTYNTAVGALPADGSGAPTRTGYTFQGWSTTAGGAADFTPTTLYIWTSNKTVYAVWKAIDYTITYVLNDGIHTQTPNKYTIASPAIAISDPTKAGQTFTGWTVSGAIPAIGNTSSLTIPSGTTGNITLTANWTAKTYTVKYGTGSAGGYNGYWWSNAASDPYNPTLQNGSKVYTIPSVTVNWDTDNLDAPRWLYIDAADYYFAGWEVTAGGNYTGYVMSSLQYNDLVANDAVTEITLTAKWDQNPLHVFLDFNDDNATPEQIIGLTDKTKTVHLPTPTRTGYTFGKWKVTKYEAADVTGGLEFNGGAAPAYENLLSAGNETRNNVTLTAQWSPNSYTVIFNANTGSGAISPQEYDYDMEEPLTPNTFTKTGYHFIGWGTNTSVVTYTDNQLVKNLATTGTVTLYAIWEANAYKVEFDANGGTGAMGEQSFIYNVAQNLTLNAYNRTGYTFLGWSENSAATTATYTNGQSVNNLTAVNDGKVKLFAIWAAMSFTLTFDPNGGVAGSTTSKSVLYNTAVGALPATAPDAPKRTGYTFKGWSTTGNTADFTAATVYIWASNKTVYAVWEANKYTITYNGNGATNVSMNSQTATYGNNVTLNTNLFEKPGYAFGGWDGDNGVHYADGASFSPWNLTGDLTLTAAWTQKTYTVHYETGKAGAFDGYWLSGATKIYTIPDETGVKWDDVLTIPPRWLYIDAPDYYFSYWQVTGNGKNSNPIGGNATFGELALNDGVSDITITAIWDKNPYHVYLKYDDGVTTTAIIGVANPSDAISLPVPSNRRGYTLTAGSEWKVTNYNEGAVNGTSYAAGANPTFAVLGSGYTPSPDPLETITLTAQWTPINYTITYDLDGGASIGNPSAYTIESAPVSIANPTRAGYVFSGWIVGGANPAIAETLLPNVSLTIPTGTTGNITLTAKWTLYAASVTPISKTFTSETVGYGVSAAQEFSVSNTGTGDLTGLKAVLAGGAYFEISAALSASGLVAGTGTVTVGVRPKTGLPVGTYNDNLEITGDNGISLTVSLSFAVNAPLPVIIYSASIDPTNKTFTATVGYDAQTAQVFTVSNTGTGNLTGLSASLTSGANYFEITAPLSGSTLAAGAGVLTVSVRPKTGLPPGVYIGVLTVTGDHGIHLTANLSFTVGDYLRKLTATPLALDFGYRYRGYSTGDVPAPQKIYLENLGLGTIHASDLSFELASEISGSPTGFEYRSGSVLMSGNTSIMPNGSDSVLVSVLRGLPVGVYLDTLFVIDKYVGDTIARVLLRFEIWDYVTPVIMREVYLTPADFASVSPDYGLHWVESRNNFEFTVTANDGFDLSDLTVTTGSWRDTTNGYIEMVKYYENGEIATSDRSDDVVVRVCVLIRFVNENIVVTLNGISPVGNEFAVSSPLKAWSRNNILYLSGIPEGKPFSIYGFTGVLIYKGLSDGSVQQIRLSASGIYVVKTDEEMLKVIVR